MLLQNSFAELFPPDLSCSRLHLHIIYSFSLTVIIFYIRPISMYSSSRCAVTHLSLSLSLSLSALTDLISSFIYQRLAHTHKEREGTSVQTQSPIRTPP